MSYISNKDKNASLHDRVLELYDSAPYSSVLSEGMQQNTPLLINWINAVCSPERMALGPNSTILVPGCGAGEEVFMLAQLYPTATVIGVDFSVRSIEIAIARGKKYSTSNFQFHVEDLMTSEWTQDYPLFDFILCRGVADYVADPSQLMRMLSQCLHQEGVICMMMNTPFHPAHRLRHAFSELGIKPKDFANTSTERKLLQLADQLMGDKSNLQGFSSAPKTYLDIDIFSPIAHHDSLEIWCNRAQSAGLSFAGSMDGPIDLTKVPENLLPMFFQFGKAKLSFWMANMSQRPGMQLLFKHSKLTEPRFENLELLWNWKPRLDASLGILPEMEKNPNQTRQLLLRFQGLPDFNIACTAYDIEVLRRCNGETCLSEIQRAIHVKGNLESLRSTLFRAYHYGLLA